MFNIAPADGENANADVKAIDNNLIMIMMINGPIYDSPGHSCVHCHNSTAD